MMLKRTARAYLSALKAVRLAAHRIATEAETRDEKGANHTDLTSDLGYMARELLKVVTDTEHHEDDARRALDIEIER